MNRKMKKITVGTDQVRYVTTITGDELELDIGEPHKRMLQSAILRTLVDQPALMESGSAPFDKLRMWWEGTHWTIELESLVKI